MRHLNVVGLLALTATLVASSARAEVVILAEPNAPQVSFAVQELQAALAEKHIEASCKPLSAEAFARLRGDIVVLGSCEDKAFKKQAEKCGAAPGELKPEGFSIRKTEGDQATVYWVLGADEAGAMYGGLELAEQVRCNGLEAVVDTDQNPYMALRGIKFNCPLDERTPTYHAHTGDSQRKNVAVMWDFDFWKAYIDDMARYRYNYLSLWNLHPFPSMVRVPGYEDVALDDVQTVDGTIKMSMDEKIDFWRKVMRYAKDRNVDVYIVTWNIFVLGTEGKHGLTDKPDNKTTIDYFRKSVKQLFLTYPDLAGIGITSGENMRGMNAAQKEDWVFATYGQGVLDAAEALPGRKITFIHRQHQTGAQQIAQRFQPLFKHPDIDFIFSFKYAQAHCFSAIHQPFCEDFVKDLGDLKTIWTLRNDSNYYFRWGSADFVRRFIAHIPYDVSRGYYYGSDGWVWGRDFVDRDSNRRGMLDMQKHWYHWMLFGRLGYNPKLGNDRLIAVLASRFPETDAEKLFTAWHEASMIYPVTTGFHWGEYDFQWYIEGCVSRPSYAHTKSGFHDVNRFINLPPHPGTDNIGIPEYVEATVEGKKPDGTTPLQVVEKLHGHADKALAALEDLPRGQDPELGATLDDIRTMAYLGKYYAHKIAGSTYVALARETKNAEDRNKAVAELTKAAEWWDRYVASASSRYVNPIELNRVGVVDWQALTKEVYNDIDIAREAGK